MRIRLTPELILDAYRAGLFPMGHPGTHQLYWFSPDPRCILEFDRFHVPRSLRQVIRRGVFDVRIDTAFDAVVEACGDRDEGTWISNEIRAVYRELFRTGFVHTVESWDTDADGKPRLAGGLYGLAIGGAFFGESMFYRVPNASKIALVALMGRLRQRGFALVDIQWPTPHLEMFGCVEIQRDQYLRRLEHAQRLPCTFVERVAGESGLP